MGLGVFPDFAELRRQPAGFIGRMGMAGPQALPGCGLAQVVAVVHQDVGFGQFGVLARRHPQLTAARQALGDVDGLSVVAGEVSGVFSAQAMVELDGGAEAVV